MRVPVTAARLYDLVTCPHRVTMDLIGDPTRRDPPNPFVELLWERGSLYEREVIDRLETPCLDLSRFGGDEREGRTVSAMDRGEPLVYGGRIRADNLLGDPDLLRKEGGGYIAGDIKSGAGEEGPEDHKTPKLHYAVQLGLYTDILERPRAHRAARRREMAVGRLATLFLAVIGLLSSVPVLAVEGAQRLLLDLVKIEGGKFVYDDVSLCQLNRPGARISKFQVRSRATAPAEGVITRDRFVSFVTLIETQIALEWAEAGVAMRPSQALSALDCEPLEQPIGQVDIEITTTMTSEGMQTEYRDTATGKVNRSSRTWKDLFESK